MKFGVVVFPGSNCDRDMMDALRDDLGQEVVPLWHKDRDLKRGVSPVTSKDQQETHDWRAPLIAGALTALRGPMLFLGLTFLGIGGLAQQAKPMHLALEVIEAVGLNPAMVLAVRNGKLVLDSEMLGDDDELKLIAVISGG